MTEKCPPPAKLLALADGALSGTSREELQEHVQECSDCARVFAGLRETVEALRGAVDTAGLTDREECPEWELVAAYADGSASGNEAARAESHLARCPWCLAFAADLWRGDDDGAPVDDSILERMLGALVLRARTAVVRWADDAFSIVRGFAAGPGEGARFSERGNLVPSGAARGGSAVSLAWEGGDDVALECEVRLLDDRPALLGRVTTGSAPARGVSVALRGAGTGEGPESPDALGRFGPWPLAPGRNELVLRGARLEGGAAELAIELVGDDA